MYPVVAALVAVFAERDAKVLRVLPDVVRMARSRFATHPTRQALNFVQMALLFARQFVLHFPLSLQLVEVRTSFQRSGRSYPGKMRRQSWS